MARTVGSARCAGHKRKRRQGRMTDHRPTLSLLTFLTVLAVMPSVAVAGSLLGGYGGPGEGNQAILGSALLKGGGGSGGGPAGPTDSSATGSSPTGSSAATEVRGGVGSAAPTVSRAQGSAAAGGASSTAGEPSPRPKAERTTGGGRGAAHRGQSHGLPPRPTREGSGYLGLSGEDFLYILLALAVLACTGVLTRRLSRAPADPHASSAKGHGRRVRITE